MKLKVAVVAGGDSAEEQISLKTADTVFKNLDRQLYDPYLLIIRQEEWLVKLEDKSYSIDKNDFSFLKDKLKVEFDYVFIAIHGTPGEDGKLQGYFDLLEIPYSSPNHIGSTLTFNKWYCNTLLSQLGYKVSQSYYLRKEDKISSTKIVQKVGLPCFVKPCSCGSSYGISKVKEEVELNAAITEAFKFDVEVMVEAFMPGKEVSCGVFIKEGVVTALPVTQIIPEGEWFDYEAKYLGSSQEITPAPIEKTIYSNVQQIAREVYQKLDLRGVVRIDFILVENQAHIIEVNAVPGMSEESLIPQQVKEAGISLKEFYTYIINETK